MKIKNKVFGIFGIILLFASCNPAEKKNEIETAVSVSKADKLALESENTLRTANAFMAAMGKGDMEAMKSLMHDDMVWQNAGNPDLAWIGPWNGKKAILEDFFPAFGQNFITKKWEPSDAIANGDTAAYFGQMIGLLTNSNKETKEFTYALRVKVKDEKVILWNWFEDSFEVSRVYFLK